jgi:DNA repair protein RadD
MKYELRPMQIKACNEIQYFINSRDGNGIVVAPCAFGKSIVIAETAIMINAPVLVLQPSKELLQQNYDKYISYGLNASIYSASLGKRELGNVIFATPKSITPELSKLKEMGIKYVIQDECHLHSKKKGVVDSIVSYLGARAIGFTATPVYLEATMAGTFLKPMSYSHNSFYKKYVSITQCGDMVSNGYWSNLIYMLVTVNLGMLNISQGEYSQESLDLFSEVNQINDKIIHYCSHEKMQKCKSILVFVTGVELAKNLSLVIPNSVAVYGDMPLKERNEAINGFKSGKYRVCLNVKVLGTGFDFPELECIIHARPTNSVASYYQEIARVIRTHKEKEKALLIDLSGNSNKFGKIEDFWFGYHNEEKEWQLRSGHKCLTYSKRNENIVKQRTQLAENRYFLCTFGKYSGETILSIYTKKRFYFDWLLNAEFKGGASEKFQEECRKFSVFINDYIQA